MKLKTIIPVLCVLTLGLSSDFVMAQTGMPNTNVPNPITMTSEQSKNAHHYFGQGPASPVASTDYGNNTTIGHYALSGDTKIYYEVYGTGNPLVLLHGGMVGTPGEMGQLADKLKDNHTVIMIATRGHGRSEIGHASMSFEQKAKDVAAVLQDAHIQGPVDLIGFSDGAYTGYYFAKEYPQQIDHLIAIGAGKWDKGFVQGGRKLMKTFDDMVALDKRFWNEQLQEVRPEPERAPEWFYNMNTYYNRVEVGKSVFNQVRANTLLIVGEKDANAPLQTVIDAYKILPNAELGVVPNAPHPVLQTNFDIVWPMIDQFLK